MRVARTYRFKIKIDEMISRMAADTGLSKTAALELLISNNAESFISKYQKLLNPKKAK